MVRLQAKHAMSDKAVELSAAQVVELQGALQDQAESLESSESSREALQVTTDLDPNPNPEACPHVTACNPCKCMQKWVTCYSMWPLLLQQ